MIRKKITLVLAMCTLVLFRLYAQERSSLTVRYMLSYDDDLNTYTAWVVPNYNTPNENNAETDEKGATAQLTLRVPKGFNIENIRDIRGAWDKNPIRFGSEEGFQKAGADMRFEYYVIGKAPVETNYGSFRQNEPVALFSFSGKGGAPQDLNILESRDPFITIADQQYALNVSNSFYSRSGQSRSVNATPIEQFTAPIDMSKLLTELANKVDAQMTAPTFQEFNKEMQLITYPNPVVNLLKINYFSIRKDDVVQIELVEMNGQVRNKTQFKAEYGVNTLEMPVSSLSTGIYLVRMKAGKEMVNRKILKVN
ncbi:T9SS type A sorting domain-containing protein [Arundinibacter roseus]|uniref:T9SS type A sorting domain-containing protein n=1 Tax=Arundinibacter roseus TaxID=2070510 RepID=A0A4V6P8J1_9BACT|nr:T9SS type A sorting domain-containing protein [Arundinibacter roseus]TDB61105.1 T9SS type A sorting domain-containing protein [Arundinibacter roseus]